MKKLAIAIALVCLACLMTGAYVQPDPGGRDGFQINTSTGDIIIMRAGTIVQTVSSTGDLTVADDLVVTDDAAIGGLVTVGETLGVTGVLTATAQAVLTAGFTSAVTAADAINLTGAAPTMTVKDNEAAAFVIASSGAAALMTFDTRTGAEVVSVAGDTATSVFAVPVGFATLTEQAVLTAGADVGGALLCGAGAGSVTFDAASSSILMSGAADNAAIGLDIGTTGDLAMQRFITTDDAEFVEFRSAVIPTFSIYEAFGEGATKGLATLQADGTARDITVGVHNIAYTGGGNKFAYTSMGDNQTIDLTMSATGLVLSGDQADNEGNEIMGVVAGASGRPIVIGTDPAGYFLFHAKIANVSGTDTFMCGLRTMEVQNAALNAYDTYVGLGTTQSAATMVLEIVEEVNGDGGAVTNTLDTLADTILYQAKLLWDATGNVTFLHDSITPGSLIAPTAVVAFQFDDGDLVMPFCHYLEHNAGGLTTTVEIPHWEIGIQ